MREREAEGKIATSCALRSQLGSGSASAAAPPPVTEATEPVNLDELVSGGSASAAAAAPAPAAIEDGFFDAYTPAPTAPPPEPESADPRVAWRKKNADALKGEQRGACGEGHQCFGWERAGSKMTRRPRWQCGHTGAQWVLARGQMHHQSVGVRILTPGARLRAPSRGHLQPRTWRRPLPRRPLPRRPPRTLRRSRRCVAGGRGRDAAPSRAGQPLGGEGVQKQSWAEHEGLRSLHQGPQGSGGFASRSGRGTPVPLRAARSTNPRARCPGALVQTRTKTLTTRKETNRANAKVSTEAGVPKEGTAWEKVRGSGWGDCWQGQARPPELLTQFLGVHTACLHARASGERADQLHVGPDAHQGRDQVRVLGAMTFCSAASQLPGGVWTTVVPRRSPRHVGRVPCGVTCAQAQEHPDPAQDDQGVKKKPCTLPLMIERVLLV